MDVVSGLCGRNPQPRFFHGSGGFQELEDFSSPEVGVAFQGLQGFMSVLKINS
jgi:hypothetical protein